MNTISRVASTFGPVRYSPVVGGRVAIILPVALQICPACHRVVLAEDVADGTGSCSACAAGEDNEP